MELRNAYSFNVETDSRNSRNSFVQLNTMYKQIKVDTREILDMNSFKEGCSHVQNKDI